MGVSSETLHVSLCGRAQGDTHCFTKRPLGQKLSGLFLSLPIDFFSGYSKESTDKTERIDGLVLWGLTIDRLDLDDTASVEYSKSSQDIVSKGNFKLFSLKADPGKKEKPPCVLN